MREDEDYKKLLEESPIPMYVYDQENYSFSMVNDATLLQYGYSRDEFKLLTARDIRPQEDVDQFYDTFEKIPEPYYDTGRWRHKNKQGTIFYVRVYTRRIVFAGKDAIMVFAVNIDKIVKMEAALREKNKESEIMLNSITDGFFAVNKNWELTYINKECERIFRLPRQQLIGRVLWELFPNRQHLQFYTEFMRVMNERKSAHFEEYDPIYEIWISANAYPAKDGIAVYIIDITDQKEINEQIHRDQQNLRAIINNTKDIIWSMDTEYQLISANEAFWKRLAQISGRPVRELKTEDYTPEMSGVWRDYFQQALAGQSFQIIWEHRVDGIVYYDEVSFNPICDRDRRVIGVSCFSRDITAQKKYDHKIEMQNQQLKEIAWIQSHQVRNHVATIKGLLQFIDMSSIADTENADLLKMIMKSADDLDKAIHDINIRTQSMD